MRGEWTDCNSAIKGPRNWGNSGVKIFNFSAAGGAKIAISDFVWPSGVPYTPGDGTGPVPSSVQICASGSQLLPYNRICGAIYGKTAPQSLPPISSGSSAANDPKPNGNWNTLEIGFMARRYDASGAVVKLATVTVKINDVTVLHRVGIANQMTVDRQDDDYLAGPNKGEPVYPGGVDWKREFGFILLQEHDNMVQFKDIRINPDWLPMAGGQFDTSWQRNP